MQSAKLKYPLITASLLGLAIMANPGNCQVIKALGIEAMRTRVQEIGMQMKTNSSTAKNINWQKVAENTNKFPLPLYPLGDAEYQSFDSSMKGSGKFRFMVIRSKDNSASALAWYQNKSKERSLNLSEPGFKTPGNFKLLKSDTGNQIFAVTVGTSSDPLYPTLIQITVVDKP